MFASLQKTINNNLHCIAHYLINLSVSCRTEIIPLFKFNDNNEEDFELCTLNNNYTLYINKENYEKLGIKNRKDLCNKDIVYMIYNQGGIYIGQTTDFNERMHSHIKDANIESKKKLYESIRHYKTSYVTILHCYKMNETENISEGIEKEYLNEIMKWSLNDSINHYIYNNKK